ncbi:hypothetical protein [Roseofilum capinflatum]|uniref:Uncharacterized protein n=1 Tax=Roseofilum capinflatum BLCC-M114 TaxID=3022440 RepID=A0ABT7BB23_9CYAN|nr:hypothetical protein [Roseofilum capinflatum]MDJ1175819.1 hypothetical protein [Roseofilum capinflatum BLCC-M114]
MSWETVRRHLSELTELISQLEYENLNPEQKKAKASLIETYETMRTRVIAEYWREIEMKGSYMSEDAGLMGVAEQLKDALEADGNYLGKTQEAFDAFMADLQQLR